MNVFRAGWHVIYTKPRHEKKVCAYLTGLEIRAFLPTKKILRSWHDRKRYIDEPLFPSYVFAYLNDIRSYYAGMDADGALYYVKNGREIARVSDAVIGDIRLITSQEMEIAVSAEQFLPGRKLVIQEGPLTGLSCEIVQSKNSRKLLVRVDLLSRNLLLSVNEKQLLAI